MPSFNIYITVNATSRMASYQTNVQLNRSCMWTHDYLPSEQYNPSYNKHVILFVIKLLLYLLLQKLRLPSLLATRLSRLARIHVYIVCFPSLGKFQRFCKIEHSTACDNRVARSM